VQSFLRVAQAGSLSAAARDGGHSQPTLGRHIRLLEAALGQPLFTRHPDGQHLTPFGLRLLDDAQDMQAAAARLSLTAAGSSAALTGTVRITAARVVAQWHLPPILAQLRAEEPGIALELVASDTSENLLHGEADIALRMFRPDRGDLVAQKITELPLGLYAARSYLERVGIPTSPADLMDLDFVGYDRSDLIVRLLSEQGMPVTRDFFATRCDDQIVNWALVCAGAGIGGFQTVIADDDRRVQRIADFITLPRLPVWLVVPRALRHVARIARVRDALAHGMSRVGG
jgi:DNA-binding transcriptional LysR family regulator